MFTVDEAEEEDIQIVSELEKEIFLEEAWSFKQLLEEFKNSFSSFWILKVNGEIIGYIVFRKIKPEIEILRIGIKRKYQRRGAGTKLMKSLLTFAKEEKFNKIFLEVNISNVQAYNFYKKLGFKEFYERKNYYGNETAIVMLKEL